MQLNIPKIVGPSSSFPLKPLEPPEALDEDWCQQVIDLLAESVNRQADWAKERSQHYECYFYLSTVGGEVKNGQASIPLLMGETPSKETLDRLMDRLLSGTAWELKRSTVYQRRASRSDAYEGKPLYRVMWQRRYSPS